MHLTELYDDIDCALGCDPTTGTPVTVTLPLPGEKEEVKCRGTVAWVNHPKHATKEDYPQGIGIQFVDLNPNYRDAIHRYVKKMLDFKSE